MDSLQLKAFYERFDFVAFDESKTYYIEMQRKARVAEKTHPITRPLL